MGSEQNEAQHFDQGAAQPRAESELRANRDLNPEKLNSQELQKKDRDFGEIRGLCQILANFEDLTKFRKKRTRVLTTKTS